MKINFGVKPAHDEKWEVYSHHNVTAINKKYWRTLDCAQSYAKILSHQHNSSFRVRWCQPYPVKPIKRLTST